MDKKIKIILVIIIILFLIALNLLVYINNHKKEPTNIENELQEINTIVEHNIATEEETEQARKEMISKYSEATRMKIYYGQYISAIDSGNYEKAYSLLYENFKNTYFKTIEEFKKYVEEKYPKEISVNYTNMQREGTMYILTVKIEDPLNKEYKPIEQRVVIQENNLNDFVLSFNVE